MSVMKSEDFLYFQNKASHYNSLLNAKSRISTKLPANLRHTIDHGSSYNRDLSYNRKYEIRTENQSLTNRILGISGSHKTAAEHDGTYVKYNKFERSFRTRNPQKVEEERLIEIQNQKIKKKLSKMRAKVGSLDVWRDEYRQKQTAVKNMSRYIDGQKSKGDLKISKDSYLLDPYLKFIETIQHGSKGGEHSPLKFDESKKTLEEINQKNVKEKDGKPHPRKKISIQKEKLFILPLFPRNSSIGSLNSSKSRQKLVGSSLASNPNQQKQSGQ